VRKMPDPCASTDLGACIHHRRFMNHCFSQDKLFCKASNYYIYSNNCFEPTLLFP
jgi:hypothetical protein